MVCIFCRISESPKEDCGLFQNTEAIAFCPWYLLCTYCWISDATLLSSHFNFNLDTNLQTLPALCLNMEHFTFRWEFAMGLRLPGSFVVLLSSETGHL